MVDKIKEMRMKRGWTQKELSIRSGVPQPMISDIETGQVPNPTISTVCRLAHALGCFIEDLITQEKAV